MSHPGSPFLEEHLRLIGTLREEAPTAGRSRFGVGFETLDRQLFDPERVYPHLSRLGASWARVQSGWSRCEKQEGVFDFAWLERIVDELGSRGVAVVMSLTFGNVLYSDAPHESAVGFTPTGSGDRGIRAWERYVRAVVERLGDRVQHWEVWNEPNIPQFWAPGHEDGADYATLVAVTARTIRAVKADAVVIGGAQSQVDPMFLQECLDAGMAEHIDAFSFHPYQAVPEHNLANALATARGLLDRYSPDRRIEIWQGEAGCPSQVEGHNDDWLGLERMDEEIQAKWVARRLVIDRALGFDRVFYFHAVDLMSGEYRQSDGTPRRPVMMGLIHGDTYETKHAFDAFRRIARILDDRSEDRGLLWRFFEPDANTPQTSELLAAPHVATFARDGAPLFAYWVSSDPQRRSTEAVVTVELWWDRELQLTRPVVVDPISGHVYAIDRTERSYEPIVGPVLGEVMTLPLTDYPLILTDLSAIELAATHEPIELSDEPLPLLRARRYRRGRA